MHRFQRWKSPDLRLRLLVLLFLILSARAMAAQELAEVLARLERSFVVHTLTDGYALQSAGGKDALLIEVRAGAVAIDGEPVGDEVLRARVGRDDTQDLRALSAITADVHALRAVRQIIAEGRADSRSEVRVEAEARDRARAERERRKAEEHDARERAHERARRERESQDRVAEEDRPRERARTTRRAGDRLRLLHSVRVERDETVSDAVAVLGNVTVRGEVRNDAVAVGGTVRVEGSVRGDVTAIGGSVILGPNARIGGDATAVGGEVRRARDAEVRGSIHEISLGGASIGSDRGRRDRDGSAAEGWFGDWGGPGFGWTDWPRHMGPSVFERLINAGLLTVLTLVVLLVARRRTERLAKRVTATPLRAAAAGVAAQVATLPLLALASLVLLVSVIGIPLLLLVPVALLALLTASLLGYAGAAAAVGRWLSQRLGRVDDGPLVVAVVGVTAVQGLSILGEVFDGLFGPFGLFGLLLLTLGFGVRYAAWTVGLGAVVLATFGRKLDRNFELPPPPPPVERERGGDPLSGWRA